MSDASTRTYAVLCDSPKHPGQVIAHINPNQYYTHTRGYWVMDDPERMGRFTLEQAERIRSGLSYNNPRVVRFEKALGKIMIQKHAAKATAPSMHELLAAKAATQAFLDGQPAGTAPTARA